VGFALASIRYATAYCPAEPATSSMDMALRAAGIYRRGELKRGLEYYRSLLLQLMR
jgi:hypothetical protein